MTRKTFLHVGTAKSGTTYLQAVLGDNKARLAKRDSLLFPGRNWFDQVRAVRDIRGQRGRGGSPEDEGAWRAIVDEIADWHGNAVFSMEWLAGSPARQIGRIVESLSARRIEVILTVRDLARTIPAAWQELMQNSEVWAWPDFVAAVTSDSPRGTPAGNVFWVQQDLSKILANWGDHVPAEQIHVVTVPPSGTPPGELWDRFGRVLGIDPAAYDSSGRGSNESLGRESAELMRRINEAARSRQIEWSTYEEMFKRSFAKRGLSARRHIESPQHRLPVELEDWTRLRTEEQVRAIVASGATVVGSLADLEPHFDDVDEFDTGAEGMLEAAIDGLVTLAIDRGEELTRLRQRLAEARPQGRRKAPPSASVLARARSRARRIAGRGRSAIRRARS